MATAIAEFGPLPKTFNRTAAPVAHMFSNVKGCIPFNINEVQAITGNVLFVVRGGCPFAVKVKHGQDAGAIGVIITNYEQTPVSTLEPSFMAKSGDVLVDEAIKIPSFLVSREDGDAVYAALDVSLRPLSITHEAAMMDALALDLADGVEQVRYRVVHEGGVHVRSGPSDSAPIVGRLEAGAIVDARRTLVRGAEGARGGTAGTLAVYAELVSWDGAPAVPAGSDAQKLHYYVAVDAPEENVVLLERLGTLGVDMEVQNGAPAALLNVVHEALDATHCTVMHPGGVNVRADPSLTSARVGIATLGDAFMVDRVLYETAAGVRFVKLLNFSQTRSFSSFGDGGGNGDAAFADYQGEAFAAVDVEHYGETVVLLAREEAAEEVERAITVAEAAIAVHFKARREEAADAAQERQVASAWAWPGRDLGATLERTDGLCTEGDTQAGCSLLLLGEGVWSFFAKQKFYKGYIQAFRQDGTMDVQYDDGDFESTVSARHIVRPGMDEYTELEGGPDDAELNGRTQDILSTFLQGIQGVQVLNLTAAGGGGAAGSALGNLTGGVLQAESLEQLVASLQGALGQAAAGAASTTAAVVDPSTVGGLVPAGAGDGAGVGGGAGGGSNFEISLQMGGKGALEMVIKPHAASTVATVATVEEEEQEEQDEQEEQEEQEGAGHDGVEAQVQGLGEMPLTGMSNEELMAALDDMEEQVLAAP